MQCLRDRIHQFLPILLQNWRKSIRGTRAIHLGLWCKVQVPILTRVIILTPNSQTSACKYQKRSKWPWPPMEANQPAPSKLTKAMRWLARRRIKHSSSRRTTSAFTPQSLAPKQTAQIYPKFKKANLVSTTWAIILWLYITWHIARLIIFLYYLRRQFYDKRSDQQ